MAKSKNNDKAGLKAKNDAREFAEFKKTIFYFFLVIFTAAAAFSAFDNLGSSGVIIEWDEARHGVSAYEMVQSGNFIVSTYQGAPDYWNVKPPLSLWQIALAYRLFGYGTFALRFFSALYLPLIVVLSMAILNKYTGLAASLTTGFLFAATGTRFFHLFKSGDPDALFFFMCFLTCLFLYVANKESKPVLLIGAGVCTALAFLTKATHVVSVFLVIAVYLAFVMKKRTFSVKQLVLYLFVSMAAPVLIWAALRFSCDGVEFFRQMYLLDVQNRVTGVVENHSGGPDFYIVWLKRILGDTMFYGIALTVAAWLVIKFIFKKESKTDGAFIAVFGAMALAPVIIFTMATTKLAWYVFPCMVGVYFIVGYAVQQMSDVFVKNKKRIPVAACLLVCIAFILTGGFIRPYKGDVNMLTTDVTSADSLFSKVPLAPGTQFFVVDPQGGREEGILQSWLLQAYYLGLKYNPGGIGEYDASAQAVVVLKHGDDAQLNAFIESYPQFETVAQSRDYNETIYTMLQ